MRNMVEAFVDIQNETAWCCCGATTVQLGNKGESAHEMNALKETLE